MRLWPWLLLLLRATTALRTTAGLSASVARALRRIRDTTRDVRLSDDLWFEAVGPFDEEGTSSTKEVNDGEDLLRLADQVFDTHRLRWRDAVVSGVDVAVRKERTRRRYVLDVSTRMDTEDRSDPDTRRTFGMHRRRMQLVMLPIMYKLGVITTLLTGLTVLSLKGVTIGVILLILAATSFAAKASKFGHYSSYGPPSSSYYDPFDRSSQHPIPSAPASSSQQDKNIHVHLHTGPASTDPVPASSVGGVAYSSGRPRPVGSSEDGAYNDSWYRAAAADEYYDTAAANPYASYRGGGRPTDADGSGRPAEPTSSSGGVYHRWLG